MILSDELPRCPRAVTRTEKRPLHHEDGDRRIGPTIDDDDDTQIRLRPRRELEMIRQVTVEPQGYPRVVIIERGDVLGVFAELCFEHGHALLGRPELGLGFTQLREETRNQSCAARLHNVRRERRLAICEWGEAIMDEIQHRQREQGALRAVPIPAGRD